MSNKTGRYKWNPKTQKMELLYARPPNVCVFDCFVPDGGYLSTNIGHKPVYLRSRAEKRKILKERGLKESGSLTRREI